MALNVVSDNKAEDTYTTMPFDDDKGNTVLTAYSRDNSPKTIAEFETARNQYVKGKGKEGVPGFIFLTPGVVSNLRNTFEKVNTPIQQGAAAIGNSIDPPAVVNNISDAARGTAWLAAQLPQVAASTVKTPERALTTAGTIGAMSATGGMSLLPQVLGVAGAAGLSNLAAQHLYGGAQGRKSRDQLAEAGTEAGLAALAQGAPGLLRVAIGRGLSERASKGMAEEMFQYIKGKYGAMSQNPEIINAMTGTPSDISALVQMGMKGLRGDVDSISKSLTSDVWKQLPVNVSKDTVDTLKDYSKEFVKRGNKLIDAVGNEAATKAAQASIDEISTLLLNTVRKEMSNVRFGTAGGVGPSSNFVQQQVGKVHDLLVTHLEEVQKLQTGQKLFDVLKRAGVGEKFDRRAIQQELRGIYRQEPGSDIEAIGRIAGGGSELTEGVDSDIRAKASASLGMTGFPTMAKMYVSKKLGERFVGDISGTLPKTTAASQVSLLAIKDYLRSDYKSKDYRK